MSSADSSPYQPPSSGSPERKKTPESNILETIGVTIMTIGAFGLFVRLAEPTGPITRWYFRTIIALGMGLAFFGMSKRRKRERAGPGT
jgi:hypothetical protein